MMICNFTKLINNIIINIERKMKERKVTASTKNICKPSTHIWWGRVMEQRKARLAEQ